MDTPLHILICGRGLAAVMTAAALAHNLPDAVNITLLDIEGTDKTDVFYGSAASPSAYDFMRSIGMEEPELLLGSNTAFSFGTHYKQWGGNKRGPNEKQRSWMQSFHLPLPVFNGVDFHHYLVRRHQLENPAGVSKSGARGPSLEPYIMPVQAAYKGAFAHPPEGRKIPLANAQYGYHVSPASWTRCIAARLPARINRLSGAIKTLIQSDGAIRAVDLGGEQQVSADLFIDCTGPTAQLLVPLQSSAPDGDNHANGSVNGSANGGVNPVEARTLRAAQSWTPLPSHTEHKQDTQNTPQNLRSSCRTLTGEDFGWTAETPLQNGVHRLALYHPNDEDAALKNLGALGALGGAGEPHSAPIEIKTGRRAAAWQGNCVAIGQSAAAVEPLTPAPLMLLQGDIERLLELIPVSSDMQVERREYNRRFREDHIHAGLFQQAFFAAPQKTAPEKASPEKTTAPYWQAARRAAADDQELSDKLAAKIEQFESRGVFVTYDYEPFSPQDWAMLHFGLGHYPARYDPLADRAPAAKINESLDRMEMAIAAMAEKMPPHAVYMSGLLRYLQDKHGS